MERKAQKRDGSDRRENGLKGKGKREREGVKLEVNCEAEETQTRELY